MVKGEKPYDQAAVDKALAELDERAKRLPTMFPESIKGLKPSKGDFQHSPKVWDGARPASRRKIATFVKAVDRGQGEDQGRRPA